MPGRRTSSPSRFLLLSFSLVLLALHAGAAPPHSFARNVPEDVGIFAELHNTQDLLAVLGEPQLWTTLAEIAGQPARPGETERWKRIIQDTVKMTPQDAIEKLCAGGIAFVGEGIGRSQDAVVICRPTAAQPPEALVATWDARRVKIEGAPPTYWLSRIGVTVHDDLLMFGDLLPPKGMFRHVARELDKDGELPRLADNALFKTLLQRVPANPDGLLFARLTPTVTTSQPATSRPVVPVRTTGLLQADHLMVALHREQRFLHLTAVGEPAFTPARMSQAGPPEVARLPRGTLFAWESDVDYVAVGSPLTQLPDDHFASLALRLVPEDAGVPKLLESLAGRTTLALGAVTPEGRGAELPPIPTAGLLLALDDPEQTEYCLEEIMRAVTMLYDSFSLARGLPPLPRPRMVQVGPTTAQVLDLGPVLPAEEQALRDALQICWAVTDDTLILATHETWLRQLLEARAGRDTLAPTLQIAKRRATREAGNVVVARTAAIEQVGQQWLDHLARTDSPVITEGWWRQRQANGMRLGIDVGQDRAGRRLTINAIQPNRPAEGFLRAGDAIIGVNSRRFRTDEPIKEIRTGIEQRPAAAWVELLVERDGVILPVRIPLPFINPIETLQRLLALGRVTEQVVYHDRGAYGFLTVEVPATVQRDKP